MRLKMLLRLPRYYSGILSEARVNGFNAILRRRIATLRRRMRGPPERWPTPCHVVTFDMFSENFKVICY